jgi:hypothetical protein
MQKMYASVRWSLLGLVTSCAARSGYHAKYAAPRTLQPRIVKSLKEDVSLGGVSLHEKIALVLSSQLVCYGANAIALT